MDTNTRISTAYGGAKTAGNRNQLMTTEERRTVRGALIAVGFRRYYSEGDETKERVINAVCEIRGERNKGQYTELFKHYDGTIVSVSWAEKSTIASRNC